MNYFHKPFIHSLLVTGLLASPAAWSEIDCPSIACEQIRTELELLRAQIQDANTNIKQLETAFNSTKQEIGILRNSSSNQLSSSSVMNADSQQKPSGRGIPIRYRK